MQVVCFPLISRDCNYSYCNLPLFTVAPKPTSPGVLTLTTPQSALGNEAAQNLDPLHPENTPDTDESSGAEPESPNLDVLGDLQVTNITSASVSLAWSVPHQVFDSFLVELSASSGATRPHVNTLPGNVRKAQMEGLSPSTQYDILLRGLVQGKQYLPLKVVATTGT